MSKCKASEKKRHCRCQPTCLEVLSKRQRKCHRQKLVASAIYLIQASKTETEADLDSTNADYSGPVDLISNEEPISQKIDSPPLQTGGHTSPTHDKAISEDSNVEDEHDILGVERSIRGADEVSDDEQPGGNADELHEEEFNYVEEEEIEGVLTIKDCWQRLEDDLDNELEQVIHTACKWPILDLLTRESTQVLPNP